MAKQESTFRHSAPCNSAVRSRSCERQAASTPSLRITADPNAALTFAKHKPGTASNHLSALSRTDLTALQRRLAEAGCYKGAVDGRASPALEAAVWA